MRSPWLVHIALFLVLLCGGGVSLPAQQDWSWALGDSVWIRFPGGGVPVVDARRTRYQLETGSCIADKNGNLRLYVNKDSIYSTNQRSVFGGKVNITNEHTNGAIMLPVAGDTNLVQVFYIGGGYAPRQGDVPGSRL